MIVRGRLMPFNQWKSPRGGGGGLENVLKMEK